MADEVPSAPHVKFRGYINGKVIVVVGRAHEYAAGTESTLQFQMKPEGAPDVQYATVYDALVTKLGLMYDWTQYNGAQWTLATNYLNAADVRCRFVLNGTASAWTDVGPITNTLNVSGRSIIDSANASLVNRAYDGNVDYGGLLDVATPDPWVGKAFDRSTRIRGIRFTTRPDGSRQRYNGSIFEAATDDTFGDAVIVHTCRSNFDKDVEPLGIDEVYFDEPITCGAIRHRLGNREQTAELEFIPADPPWQPSLTVQSEEYVKFDAVARWTVPSELCATKSRLLRRRGSARAYEPVSEWLGVTGELCVTDTDLYVGGDYQYAVETDCNHPYFPGVAVTNAPVSYRRLRQLERDSTDQTKFRTGVTLMSYATNGVSFASQLKLAFDGQTGTYPDLWSDLSSRHGPVGVNLGENAWVKGFGYVCRASSATHSRIKGTALYCASGNDVELKDRICCSAHPTRSSPDDTFYYEPSTYVPDAGAPCWYIWDDSVNAEGKSPFCCNVAEVMFFGWTQTDLDALPDLAEPTLLTFVRGPDGVDVSWSGDRNATSFALERRDRGDSVWTTVAVGLTAHTYHDGGLATGTYEYRVTASNAEESLSSTAFTCVFYVPGNGTGLRNAVWVPYGGAMGVDYRQYGEVASRGVEAVDIDLQEPPVPGLTQPARLVWSGKLIVPIAGDCRLTLRTGVGGQVLVDGVVVCAGWVPGVTEPTGVISLEAGEHTIRVDCRMADGVSGRVSCQLRWGGVMPDEAVPASQLLPDETPASPYQGDWRQVNFQQVQLGYVKAITGGWRMTASPENVAMNASRTTDNLTYLWQEVSGPFVLSTHVTAVNHGVVHLMVRNAAGDYYAVSVKSQDSVSCYYGASSLLPGADKRTMDWNWTMFPDKKAAKCVMKLDYRKDTLTGTVKQDGSDSEITVFSWNNVGQTLGRAFAVGLGVSGRCINQADIIPEFDFTDVSLKIRQGMAMIVR